MISKGTSRQRVAVLGSCVSRDIFNSKLVRSSEYKNFIESDPLTIYQTALPSLARETKIEIPPTAKIKPVHERYIREEYSGKSLRDLVDYSPELVIMDFFADIHFGVTGGCRNLTRNTMAIKNNIYTPERFDATDLGYLDLALYSMEKFYNQLDSPKVILNSARYAYQYVSKDGDIETYNRNIDKLKYRNEIWDRFDDKMESEFNMDRINFSRDTLIGDENNAWGLHPVHFSQRYYDTLWNAVKNIIIQKTQGERL